MRFAPQTTLPRGAGGILVGAASSREVRAVLSKEMFERLVSSLRGHGGDARLTRFVGKGG